MVKKITKTTRRMTYRERKRIIVIGIGENNKTKIYHLHDLEKNYDEYHFVLAPGDETDPVKVIQNTIKKAKDEELSFENGDMALSIFCLNQAKLFQGGCEKNISQITVICLATSNHCFEVWYPVRFGYTSRHFNSRSDLFRNLKRYLSECNKGKSNLEEIGPLTKNAVCKCIRSNEYYKAGIPEDISEYSVSWCDVYKLINIIFKERRECL